MNQQMKISKEQAEMLELMSKKEPLCLDLQLCHYQDEHFPVVKHPLVFSVPHGDEKNAWLNKMYEQKKRMLHEAEKAENYSQAVFIHERPYRLDALLKYATHIEDDAEFWHLVNQVWTDTENRWENDSRWRDLLAFDRPKREFFMADSDRRELAMMPKTLQIYRGTHIHEPERGFGMSWTVDYKTAKFFAKRLKRESESLLITGEIKKKDIFAYTDQRGEQEVIITNPHTLKNLDY